MLTSVSLHNSISTAQIANLFALLSSYQANQDTQQQTVTPAR